MSKKMLAVVRSSFRPSLLEMVCTLILLVKVLISSSFSPPPVVRPSRNGVIVRSTTTPQQLGEFEPLSSDERATTTTTTLLDYLDVGPVPFREAWDLQKKFVSSSSQDTLLCLEHNPVYTLGTGADPDYVLNPENVEVVRIDRGGEVTYHGPGQLVVYPVLNLRKNYRADLHWYVRALEEVALVALRNAGVDDAVRESDVTGVWSGGKKVTAIGIKVRRWVTSHGLAINIDERSIPNFEGIVPCGLEGRDVTCVNDALKLRGLPPTTVKDFCRNHLTKAFEEVFRVELIAEGEGD